MGVEKALQTASDMVCEKEKVRLCQQQQQERQKVLLRPPPLELEWDSKTPEIVVLNFELNRIVLLKSARRQLNSGS